MKPSAVEDPLLITPLIVLLVVLLPLHVSVVLPAAPPADIAAEIQRAIAAIVCKRVVTVGTLDDQWGVDGLDRVGGCQRGKNLNGPAAGEQERIAACAANEE